MTMGNPKDPSTNAAKARAEASDKLQVESEPSIVTQPKTRMSTTRRVREYEIVVSDRISLVSAANKFIEHMVTKQLLPAIGSGIIHLEIPLSENEVKTFEAALQFLKRQFDIGHSTTEPHEKRVETEETKPI